MNAFVRFHRGIWRYPIGVKAWLLVLIAANGIVPLFYLGRAEARWVVAALF